VAEDRSCVTVAPTYATKISLSSHIEKLRVDRIDKLQNNQSRTSNVSDSAEGGL
jgi:hypothetical protein